MAEELVFGGCFSLLFSVTFLFFGCFFLFLRGRLIAFSTKKIKKLSKADAIILHTYKPNKGSGKMTLILKRGALVVKEGVKLANHFNCPIFLMAGKTMPWESRTEGEVYKDYIIENFGFKNIVLGNNPDVRTTEGEVWEMYDNITGGGGRLPRSPSLRNRFIKNLLVVGGAPHMPRIYGHWKPFLKQLICMTDVKFVRVKIPLKFYIWELAMFLIEGMLPKKLRDGLLNVVGRHG